MSTYRQHAGKSLDELQRTINQLEEQNLQMTNELESARKSKLLSRLFKLWSNFTSRIHFESLLKGVFVVIIAMFAITIAYGISFGIKSCIATSREIAARNQESEHLLFTAAKVWAAEQSRQVLDLRCTHPFNSGWNERDDYYTCYVYGNNRNNEMLIEAISCNPAKKYCFKLAR